MATSPLEVELQLASEDQGIPPEAAFRHWVEAAVARDDRSARVTIRVVDEAESAGLNQRYRQRQGATNVLAFPFEAPPGIRVEDLDGVLGDLVICAPVVRREAGEQGKTLEAHWAHMAVHGTLHLLGHDHIRPEQARTMEALEVAILSALGFADPYRDTEDG